MLKKQNDTLFPWLIVLYEIAIYLSMDCYMPGMPKIAHQFGVSANLVQLTATLWILGAFSVQLILVPFQIDMDADRYYLQGV